VGILTDEERIMGGRGLVSMAKQLVGVVLDWASEQAGIDGTGFFLGALGTVAGYILSTKVHANFWSWILYYLM
jgi:hypothetical protein